MTASDDLESAVDAANVGRRLDIYVRRLCPDVPLSMLMKWIRVGRVRVNGKRAKGQSRLQEGDVVRLPTPPSEVRPPAPTHKLPPLDIVFEDDALLVVNKPAGLACHPGTGLGQDSLIARAVQHLGPAHLAVGHRPGLAQRLDRGVSGLVPIGKNTVALRALAQSVTDGFADKIYLALVDGAVGEDAGEINVPLRVDDEPMGDRPRVHPDVEHGKPAHTLFRVARRWRDATLLEVRILTGRTHQIRAHLRAIGHAILGDPRYGPKARNQKLFETHGLNRLCLHAARLQVPHPTLGTTVDVYAPLPDDISRLMSVIRRV